MPSPAGPAEGKDPRLGLSVTHRRYVTYGDAHYGGNLVDGAYALALFGDVATEVCIRTDGDEGLFASYADVQFRAPVQAGDIIEATAAVTAVGRRSRELTRGQRGLPGRPGAGAFGRHGAPGATGGGHRHRHGRRPRARARRAPRARARHRPYHRIRLRSVIIETSLVPQTPR